MDVVRCTSFVISHHAMDGSGRSQAVCAELGEGAKRGVWIPVSTTADNSLDV